MSNICPGPGDSPEEFGFHCGCLRHDTRSGFCGGCNQILLEAIEVLQQKIRSGKIEPPDWFYKTWLTYKPGKLTAMLDTERAIWVCKTLEVVTPK